LSVLAEEQLFSNNNRKIYKGKLNTIIMAKDDHSYIVWDRANAGIGESRPRRETFDQIISDFTRFEHISLDQKGVVNRYVLGEKLDAQTIRKAWDEGYEVYESLEVPALSKEQRRAIAQSLSQIFLD
jgi:hypothetical protein